MAQHDGMHDKVVLAPQTLSMLVASAGAGYYVTSATEIDTTGYDTLTVSVEPSRAITATDDIRFTPVDSTTSGGTFVAVDTAKLLPTYMADDNHKVIEPVAGYQMALGAFGTDKVVKLRFNGVAIDTANVDLVCTVILEKLEKPAYGVWDANAPDTPSTLP